jgi:plasmid stabilization system protein ParE
LRIERHPGVIENDLPGIHAYISRDNPSAAERVLDAVDETFANIAKQPESGVAYPTRNPQLEHFKINYSQGPKARNRPAQGNALGKRDRKWQAPTGRNNRCGHSFI